MSKEICISSTPHETRLAILEDDQLAEIYYERENEYTLAGSIYKGRVTRVLPGMQSAFVDIGLERDAFLYVTDFLEEQEDSEDFEKVTAPAPGGNGGRREGGRGRDSREARPARSPEESEAAAEEPRRDAVREPVREVSRETAPEPQSAPASAPAAEDEFDQGTRRWRGRRGRRRGMRSSQPREREAQDAPPVQDTYVPQHIPAEEVIEDEPTPAPERGAPGGMATGTRPPVVVLPGESLQKYGQIAPPEPRGGLEITPMAPEPVSTRPEYIAPKPSTLIEVPLEWSGTGVLPGESISRYRNTGSEPAREQAAPVAQPVDAPIQAEPVFEAQPVAEPAVESDALAAEPVAEAVIAEPALEVHHADAEAVETVEEEIEFEPEEGSASHRIDPAAPSEMRLSTRVEEAPEEVEPVHESPAASHEEWPHSESPQVETAALAEHIEKLEHAAAIEHAVADESAAPIEFAAPAPEDYSEPQAAIEPEAPSLEVIDPRESVYTESQAAPYATASDLAFTEYATPIPQASPEETAGPVETHVPEVPSEKFPEQSFAVEFEEEEASEPSHTGDHGYNADPDAPFSARDEETDGPKGFAPGSGLLEEETIDEEEYDFEPIHAHADEHDLEDLEEETLEHQSGIELGDIVRDAHLEQRVAAEPNADEDEEDEEFEDASGGFTEADFAEEESSQEQEEIAPAAGAPAPARREGRQDDRRGRGRHRRRGNNAGGGGHTGGGGRRPSAQMSDLPIISDLLKQGQEILVQIAKEPIAKKGARITSHIALPGRFLVFMPTVNHVGVSRKISSDEERNRLKRILISEKGAQSGGFIVRTAAEGTSEEELRADIRFLISLWTEIKTRSDDGKAPALIYHDLNLVERVLRDQVSDNFTAIWVDNEVEYERIVRFLNRFQPSLVRRVKLYTKETPLFEQFGIQEEITKALKSKVWLKSGGSIVINQTEALVAIDINTGKYVGKTARLEDTILRTNLDAIPEIVRQIRLRDLGGIIVIDFIDMDERKNRHKVMQALEDELKHDRAPSKVLQFNDFGLVAITRKRVKQSLERTLSVQCNICSGTGMVKSPTTVCNEIYTEMRKMQGNLERGDVLLRVNPEVVKTLKAGNAKWLLELEELTGKTIIVKSDPALHPEQFDIH
jgi:Rne/Rng family ribonuclease